MKIDLGWASSSLFPSINFQFRAETFLSIFLGWLEWPARFWEVQAIGNVVKISIQQRWASGNKHPRKPLQNHRYVDLWAERPKEMVSGRHIKDNKNGKQLNFSFSKISWASKDSLLAIGNDCVARSYRFSVPLTCTRTIIRQKVYWLPSVRWLVPLAQAQQTLTKYSLTQGPLTSLPHCLTLGPLTSLPERRPLLIVRVERFAKVVRSHQNVNQLKKLCGRQTSQHGRVW